MNVPVPAGSEAEARQVIDLYRERVLRSWRDAVEGIIECGRILLEAKKALPHGAWLALIGEELPFGPRTVQKLMAIAGDARFTEQRLPESYLPPHWSTLYELTRLDDDAFKALIDQGVIRPELSRAELKVALARLGIEAGGPAPALASLPAGKYRTIYADPPWEYETWGPAGKDRSPDSHYPTMSIDALCALPVADLAADDAVLLLWGQWNTYPECKGIIAAWGFKYSTCAFVWEKTNGGEDGRLGMGKWTRHDTEPCLIGVRGAPDRCDEGVRQLIRAPRRAHSQKPEETYARIERLVAGPYLELFANPPARPGWDTWGRPHRNQGSDVRDQPGTDA